MSGLAASPSPLARLLSQPALGSRASPLPMLLRTERAPAWLAASLTALDPLVVETAEDLEP